MSKDQLQGLIFFGTAVNVALFVFEPSPILAGCATISVLLALSAIVEDAK